MMFRFFKVIFIEASTAAGGAFLAGLMALAGAELSGAQTPSPVSKPAPPPLPVKAAYIRFWNMLPDHQNDVLQLFLGAKQPLVTTGASNDSAGYTPVVPKTYTCFVQRMGDQQQFKTAAVRMVDKSFFTILATLKNGQVDLQLIDDTIDPNHEDGSARLVLRQYYPGVHPIVTVGAILTATMNYGEAITLDHVPAGQIPIVIQVTLPSSTTKNMNMVVDLTKKHHGELILVADAYARFRPFFAVDGQTDVDLARVDPHPPQPTSHPEHRKGTPEPSNVSDAQPAAGPHI